MPLEFRPLRLTLKVWLLVAMTAATALPEDRTTASEDFAEAVSPLRESLRGMTSDELFSKLLEHNHLRNLRLQQYSAVRTYEARNNKGKVHAQETVVVHYQAPSTRTFKTTSEEGSWVIRNLVFKRLMESESDAEVGRQHRDSSIRPENYTFTIIGEQTIGPYQCIVVEAVPKRQEKYLFKGRIWIDTQDFAVVRIAGQPARKLSFWINRADFVRQNQRIGEFWLPCRDETFVDVKLYGKKVLTIDHREYTINGDEVSGLSGHDQVAVR